MSSKNRFRLNDDECLFPALPVSGQESPEEAIELPELRSPTSSVQNGELLTEREVFECQFRAEPQGGWNQRATAESSGSCLGSVGSRRTESQTISTRPGFWRRIGNSGLSSVLVPTMNWVPRKSWFFVFGSYSRGVLLKQLIRRSSLSCSSLPASRRTPGRPRAHQARYPGDTRPEYFAPHCTDRGH